MGIVSKAQGATKRVESKNAVKTGVVATKETDEFLAKFPIEMREKILKQSVRAASRVVATEARSELRMAGPIGDGAKNPTVGRSKVTGTQDKWSAKMAYRKNRRWDMHDAMGVKVKQYRNGQIILGMTGVRNRMGSQAWILEHGGTIKLWGKGTYRLPPRPFMRPAASNTMQKQRAAMEGKMKKEWMKL